MTMDPKPYKIAWRIKVKVIHPWVQDTIFGGDFLELILVDKSFNSFYENLLTIMSYYGVKIHCYCKKVYMPHREKISSIASSTGKYRSTSHKYKFNITNNTSVTDSSLILDDNFFLSLTPFEAIFSGILPIPNIW
ncbi:hypothetical protein HID58_075998 [Brassica napus]|uniref:Replication protein A 70 kDa DNA-binding subunit B/D first OB fold domain-containing protein n=1 Tax=Brassica napus TaxID=3708 RepID=A0ABQ7YPD0_BRANA|nr:hypothetical protein HID58_075998 [Brassica napus]